MTRAQILIVLMTLPGVFTTLTLAQQARIGQLHQLVHGSTDQIEPVKCGLPAVTVALTQIGTASQELRDKLAAALLRPTLQKTILVGNFRIHYDTTGSDAPAMLDAFHQPIPGSANEFADSVASIAAYVHQYEVDSLGYLPPPADNGAGGGDEYDIYIQDLSNTYGVTWPESPINGKPQGGTFTSYMTIDNDFRFVSPDSNKGLPGLRVTVAHELHHAIQLGRYGYWSSDIFFYEITSVWMEDVVFTGVNDYFQYLRASQGQFRRPETPLNSSPTDFIMYSRGIWGQFIEKKYDRRAMRRTWEEIQNARPLEAINNALLSAPYFSSLREAFGEWTLWNYFTGSRYDSARYYPEGRYYPNMLLNPIYFTPPGARSVPGNLAALGGKYYEVVLPTGAFPLILGNVNVGAAFAGASTQFPFTYLLNTQQVDQTYKPTPAGIFVKLDVSDPANWYSSDGVSGGTGPSAIVAGLPYPSPFLSDGKNIAYIPIGATTPLAGTISIFSSDMNLVYSVAQTSVAPLGKQTFVWNGRTENGELAESGIYFFAIEVLGDVQRGKLALIRK